MLKGKRILIVTPFFAPAWHYGGPPRVMLDLCSHIAKIGHEVIIATTDVLDMRRNPKREAHLNGMHIFYFRNYSNSLAYYLKFFSPRGFRKYLSENLSSFNIVHIVDFRNLCTYYTYRECLKQNIPYVITPFGTLPNTKDFKGLIKKIFDIWFGKKCLQKAKYVIVQTKNEMEETLKFDVDPKNIALIPLIIDSAKFKITESKNNIREKYKIPPTAQIILFIGRINKYKATDTMINAFSSLIKKNYQFDFRLMIVGRNDGYESKLKQLCKDLGIANKVIFTGPIFHPDTIDIYRASDVFFMAPSHFEETSTASLEALASGIPVVVTKQADIPYFNNYNAGYIVENKITEIVEALEKILLKNDYKSEDCKKIIKDNFDVESVANKYLKAYFNNFY
jgi:glycosyltransferase involved in cell wall biosynthesis